MRTTIPVGLKDIQHWKPAAYEDLKAGYEKHEAIMDCADLLEYSELLCFYVGNGHLYMTNQDEGMVWEWEVFDEEHEGCWREYDVSTWHWGEGRPM